MRVRALRKLPPWPRTRVSRVSRVSRIAALERVAHKVLQNEHGYVRVRRLPRSFSVLRESFCVRGAADAEAARKARAWVASQRKLANVATACFDEIWDELRAVACELKDANDPQDARERFDAFAATMAYVVEPLIRDNPDQITPHDFGGSLSSAGVGCVEAAWKNQSPYDGV